MPATFLVEIDDKAANIALLKLYSFALCSVWNIDALWYVDATPDGIEEFRPHEAGFPVRRIESLAAGLEELPSAQVVLVEEARLGSQVFTLGRGSYPHPGDAAYVFGGDRGPGVTAQLAAGRKVDWLAIPAQRSFYACMAATLVAFDRYRSLAVDAVPEWRRPAATPLAAPEEIPAPPPAASTRRPRAGKRS